MYLPEAAVLPNGGMMNVGSDVIVVGRSRMAPTAAFPMLIERLRRLNLWPRLAIAVALGFLVLFGVFSFLRLRAVSDSTNRILQERLVIAQMAARELDQLVERGFYELVMRLAPEELMVVGDPLRIEQVLHNLVDNAACYSDPGSRIEVGASVQDRQAVVSVVVSVKDQGDGIPAHEVTRIFAPFHRGENSRRRGVRGTGLGLAICRGIVESHGGKLWVESSLGAGSVFYFSLPLVSHQAPCARDKEDAPSMAKGEGS